MGETQINIRLPDEQKSEWKNYIKVAPEANNLSHLIRLSVTEHITGSDGTDTRSASSGMDSETTGHILNALNGLTNRIEDVQERMSALERETGANAKYDLQRVIFAVLPEGRPSEAAEKGIGASDLAARIGADVSDVRETLDDLATNSTAVWSDEDEDGRTKYVGIP